MNKVITIDGPSASGKGTLAILLAERLNWKILDSGALYRAFAYFSISENDNRLIEKELGWKPSRPLNYGLTQTYNWILEQVLSLIHI